MLRQGLRVGVEGVEAVKHVTGNAVLEVFLGCFHELLACDVLVELDVAFGYFLAEFIGHFRHSLTLFAHESVVHKPFAHEFLRQLALGFTFGETFLIAFGIEIAG